MPVNRQFLEQNSLLYLKDPLENSILSVYESDQYEPIGSYSDCHQIMQTDTHGEFLVYKLYEKDVVFGVFDETHSGDENVARRLITPKTALLCQIDHNEGVEGVDNFGYQGLPVRFKEIDQYQSGEFHLPANTRGNFPIGRMIIPRGILQKYPGNPTVRYDMGLISIQWT